MNESKHTKGPWHVKYSVTVESSDGLVVAETAGDFCTAPEYEANAALISAAPELLEACEEIDSFAWSAMEADCEEARVECMRRINKVRAAIAKARGEKP